jgi:hypothetical protein
LQCAEKGLIKDRQGHGYRRQGLKAFGRPFGGLYDIASDPAASQWYPDNRTHFDQPEVGIRD